MSSQMFYNECSIFKIRHTPRNVSDSRQNGEINSGTNSVAGHDGHEPVSRTNSFRQNGQPEAYHGFRRQASGMSQMSSTDSFDDGPSI